MSRHCLFTSAGDRNNVGQWVGPGTTRDWDLITVYYDEDPDQFARLQAVSTHCLARRGSKFQNLKALYDEQRALLAPYTHIWVVDDDVVMTPEQIATTFALCEQFDFWAAQPAFAEGSKAPHAVTRSQYPQSDIRIVTFIEMTCPLFRADKLFDFLEEYDSSVMGWGTDWWFCHHLSSQTRWRIAVLDCVEVVNPPPEQRPGGMREILRLASNEERQAQWERIRVARGIAYFPRRTLARISLSDGSGV